MRDLCEADAYRAADGTAHGGRFHCLQGCVRRATDGDSKVLTDLCYGAAYVGQLSEPILRDFRTSSGSLRSSMQMQMQHAFRWGEGGEVHTAPQPPSLYGLACRRNERQEKLKSI